MILESTMNECGYSGIWSNQTLNVSRNKFKYMIKPRLNDHFFQLWRSDVFDSKSCFNYRIYSFPRKIFNKSSTEVPTYFFQTSDV